METIFDGEQWAKLGRDLRVSADDAHEGNTPPVADAYSFLLDNAECFSGSDEWPAAMPSEAPIELIAGYYGEHPPVGGACYRCGGALGKSPQHVSTHEGKVWICGGCE